MKKINFLIIKYITIFIIGAITYMSMELVFRHRTHWAMGIVGGIALILVGLINEKRDEVIPIPVQSIIGSIIITGLEYVSGYIVNITLHLNVWDYSNLPFNIDGQICLWFSLLWILLSIFGIYLDDFIRCKLFNEKKKRIVWF